MTRRLVTVPVALAAVLVACSPSPSVAGSPKPPTTAVVEVTGWTDHGDQGYREVVVNGRHCIEHQDGTGLGSATYAISCDWTPR